MQPDLILYHGNFYTQWAARPRAHALAVYRGRIVAVGDDSEILALAGPNTKQLGLGGRFAMPGLHDAHIHFFQWAQGRQGVQLAGTRSLAECQARLRERITALPPGRWLVGQGWNETEWAPPHMPDADDLDAVSTEHPILIWRSDMHGAVANRAALAQGGVTATTPNPEGGVIERDERGQPTGRLFEMAINLVREGIPALTDEESDALLRDTMHLCHRLGLTGLHDQRLKGHEEGREALRAYQRLHAAGELTLRLTCNVDAEERHHLFAIGLGSGFGDERLQLGHMKIFLDGSLGSQTAWMIDPFEGSAENRGVVVTHPREVQQIVREAQQHGWAISVHAIGDQANRAMLDIFEELAAERSPRQRLPHRIEHVQTIQPEDLPRLARLGLVASVQPIHATDDMVAVDRLWGERGRNSYAFRRLLDSGAALALGSDCPVAEPNPFYGIHAAVTRQRRDGSPPGGWYPAECLTLAEALRGYTLGAAEAVGQAHQLGRLAPGYLADLIVLDRDPFAVEPAALAETRVEMLFFEGEALIGH